MWSECQLLRSLSISLLPPNVTPDTQVPSPTHPPSSHILFKSLLIPFAFSLTLFAFPPFSLPLPLLFI